MTKKIDRSDRRRFLKSAAVVSGTAAAATLAGNAAAEMVEETAKPEAAQAKGYRETDHVREYYRLARI